MVQMFQISKISYCGRLEDKASIKEHTQWSNVGVNRIIAPWVNIGISGGEIALATIPIFRNTALELMALLRILAFM